jgi:hypothetical protein
LGPRNNGTLLFVLEDGELEWKKQIMRVLGKLDSKGLPRAIPAEELQVMLGPNPAFCSWDASISKVSEEMARWPFLFSGHQGHKSKKAHSE